MNTRLVFPIAVLLVAGASASISAFAGPLGNELTEAPQAQSTLSRASVVAETRAAAARGELERSAYDEQVSVATARQARPAFDSNRALVKAETRSALARGELERSSYDEQMSVVMARHAQ